MASLLSAGTVLAFGEPEPAAAAPSTSQAWVTGVSAVSGSGVGETRTLTFDTGVTATETTTSISGRCNSFGTGSAGANSVAAFLEPDPPAAVRSADINCVGPFLGGGSRTATVEFSKPVIAPVFHAVNLDASRAGVSGTGITLTQLAKNNAMEVSGTTLNSTLQQALNAGCAGNDGTNPNGACGSFRLTSAAPVTAFTLANNTAGSTLPESGSNDSWSYTLSYPTAPLTKVFTPATIEAGGTSALTFTIANPANPTQPTLTPLDFTDQLPAGVTLADNAVTSTPSCGSPTVNAAAGATSVTASGISVAAGATCAITVNVTSDTPGSYINDTDNLSTSVANLIPDADTTLTVTEPPASPVPFSCVPGAPGTLFQQQPTDVYSVDLVTGASAQVGSDIFAGNLNAAGYNPTDDYMYAFDGTGSFYRIGSDWVPEPLGLPSNWTTFPVPAALRDGLNVGEFDADGHYWVSNSNSAQPGWIEIDLSDPASPTYMQVVSAGNFTMPAGWLQGPDWGYNVEDGDLYMTAYMNTVSPVRIGLVRFDTGSHSASLVRDLGSMQTPDGRPVSALFGAVYSDPDGFLYASDNGTGGIWRFEMATGAAAFFAYGPASGLNDGARCFSAPLPIDFGDAPNSFGTTLASDGPRHMISGGVHLGATVDAEADGQPNAAADGDGADEDGVTFNPALSYPSPTIRTGVDPNSQQPVQNTLTVDASADGFVSAWVDWNQDGDFLDAGEQVANAQAVTAGSNDVTFSQGSNPDGIETYVRVRYSTDAASIATPTGAAPDGEAEDYRVLVERLVQPDTCVTTGSEYYAFTYAQPVNLTGDGSVGSSALFQDVSVVNGVAVDMLAEVIAGSNSISQFPPNGFIVTVGGGDDAGWLIRSDSTIRYSFFEAGTTTPVDINGVFTVTDMDDIESATFSAADLASYAVTQGSAVAIVESGGSVTFDGNGNWTQDPESRFQFVLEDTSTFDVRWQGGSNSGFAFDGDGDFSIDPPACQDFGDAPDSYGTTLAANGANHTIVPGVLLGAGIDFDADGQPSAAADGDDTDRLADEDGVAFNPALGYPNPTIRTGVDPQSQQPIQNTVRVDASADGFVSVWVDWNQDGDFVDAGEQVTNAQAVTAGANDVTFSQATNPAGIETYVRVRYSTDAASTATPTGAAPDGEVEDYRVLVERLVQPDSCVTTGTEYYAFTFDNRVSTTGTGGVGSSSRYANVTVVEGVAVDVVIELLEGAMNAGQMPPNGIGTGMGGAFGEDDAQWQINSSARLRYSFYEAGTSVPVDVNAVFTTSDMDSTATLAERATFQRADLTGYAVTEGSAVTITDDGDIVTFRGNGGWNADPESRFQVTIAGKSSIDVLWQGGNGSGFSFDGDGDLTIQPPACADFGDAPNSYGTDLASNGPRHTITPGLTIGSQIDFDPNGQPTADATGDDADRIEDEDAFPAGTVLNPGVTTATVTVPVTNTTGGAATLYGWIDANDNGSFEASEFASISVSDRAATVDLAFSGLPALQDGTTPMVRLRLTTDVLTDDAGTPEDERAVGAATDGEVEDHVAQVATVLPLSCAEPFVEDFGAGAGFGAELPAGQTTYQYIGSPDPSGQMDANHYTVVPSPRDVHDGWYAGEDHTSDDADGRMMVVNASVEAGIFFQRTFTGLAPGAPYDFSAWIANVVDEAFGTPDLPNVTFRVVDPATGSVLEEVDTGDIPNKASVVWERFALQFVASQATVRVELVNNTPASVGNDLAIDDITLTTVCEFGDAPNSYGTLLASTGAGHVAGGPTLGTERDTESDGQPNAAADGDDNAGTASDDEDGVAAPIEISVGAGTTVSVSATNNSDEDVTLAGWIDLDGNGTFDAAERVLVTVRANSGTADYDVTLPAITTTVDTYARFRIYGEVVADPQPTGTAAAGEVEDYPVTVNEPALEITKTSDATADSRPGDTITYTITAENTGEGDYTAANPAVVLDDLSGVLDDATFNSDAEASVGADPSFADPVLSWVGPLESGDTVTITYTVTLAAGGDGVVRNVAFGPGCDPADPDCDRTTPACDPPVGGADPATGIPCAETELLLPRLTLTKVADMTDLPVDGGVVRYTLTVTNTGPGAFTAAAPGSLTDDLSAVLDDATFNDDASADVGAAAFDATSGSLAWEGALGVDEVATITYSVTYDATAGDHRLLNVACLPADLAANPADPCRSVQIPGSALQDRKSVNPASGTAVVAGQQVTYTLYFENTGLADATVDTFDDLSDVLDDAALTGGPTASNPALTAAVNGTRLDVDGTVPTGQTYTVTYTVTVNPFAQQGDHVLGNVLGGDAGCPLEDPTCRTENPVRHLSVTKTSDAAADVNTGDTVTYTVTVRNDGAADYTDDAPAIARDDLSGVLDDAAYNDDASASAGAVTYSEPILTWTGPLAVDETETLTYSVTVSNHGDHSLENAAGPVCTSPEICDPPVVVVTPLPHVVPSKSSDPASGEALNAGDVVTYVLSWTNDGEAAGVVDATDDLSDVLDDADVTSEPVASDPGISAVRDGDELRVTGPVQPDQTVTVTYTVIIRPDGERGDNIAANVLTPDVPPHTCEDGDVDCEPFVPPATTHPIGELDDWKLVDPASGGTVRPGQEVTYTLHFHNTGEADVAVDREDVLTRVLDDATVTSEPASSDPALSVAPVTGDRFAVTGTLTPGQHVTVAYTVTVRPDGERGDDRLGNALVPAGAEPDENCAPADPQRPDCTVNHVSNVIASKSADPASGAEVGQGQRVTYTLTFENVSTNPDAADVAIDYTDHLVDVLDDAAVTTGPASSDAGVTGVRDGDTIRVTGAIASGDVVTVTYSVTVKPYDQQGDHRLGNVIAVTGEEPVCAPGSPLCTVHDLLPPPPPLAITGGTIGRTAVIGALLLLLAGGGALLVSRRRRPTAG